jgi:purine-binding chemotaxis protein CheW
MVNRTTFARRAASAPSRDLQFVSFSLGSWSYGVHVADVYGIYHGLPLIPTPDLAANLDGEVQLADRRIPVINLRRFSGMEDPSAGSTARWILMVNDTSGPVGLIVDCVTEVVNLTPENVRLSPDGDTGPVRDYVTAVADSHGQSIYVPDLSRLLHDAIL